MQKKIKFLFIFASLRRAAKSRRMRRVSGCRARGSADGILEVEKDRTREEETPDDGHEIKL